MIRKLVLTLAAAPALAALVPAADTRKPGVTYTRDVAPILARNCVTCHRAGEIGPMGLTSYAEARPWAKAIREAVVSRKMPPWHADPHYGVFENDPKLAPKEVDTLVAWADAGAPQGEARDLPAAPSFPSGWVL